MLPRLNRSQTSVTFTDMDQKETNIVLYSKKYTNLYMKRAQNSRKGHRKSPEWAGEEGEWDKRYKAPQDSIPPLKFDKHSNIRSHSKKRLGTVNVHFPLTNGTPFKNLLNTPVDKILKLSKACDNSSREH